MFGFKVPNFLIAGLEEVLHIDLATPELAELAVSIYLPVAGDNGYRRIAEFFDLDPFQ